ncbi:MAG: META domain-containing protein [Acidimicrobiia bacterium]|nr:META domain-containing protein [Acidimicrobiia bacterium]
MRKHLLAFMAVLLLVGCDSVAPTTTTEPPGGTDLLGTSWVGSRIEWQGTDYPIALNSPPTIEFTADGVGGTTGCNSWFGSVSLGEGSISIDQIGQTEMGCEQPLMDQEQTVVQILLAADLWTLDGGTLTIGDSQGAGLIEYVAPIDAPAVPLIGTTWVLSEVMTLDAVSTPFIGVEPTLVFDGDEISGSGGCNEYSARAIIENGRVEITNLTFTERACADAGAMEQEAMFFRVLEAAETYLLDGPRLTIQAPTEGLGFRAS